MGSDRSVRGILGCAGADWGIAGRGDAGCDNAGPGIGACCGIAGRSLAMGRLVLGAASLRIGGASIRGACIGGGCIRGASIRGV